MQDIATFISHHLGLTYAVAAVFLLLMIIEVLRLKRNNFSVDVTKAVQLINRENAVVIDTRANDLYRQGHIIDSISIPGRDVLDHPKKIEKYRNKPLILVCHTGLESQKTAALLKKQGYNTFALAGGTRAWSEAQLPLIKG